MERNMGQELTSDSGSGYVSGSVSGGVSDGQEVGGRRKQHLRRLWKRYCLSSLLTIAIACVFGVLLEMYFLIWAGVFLVVFNALLQGILSFLYVRGLLDGKPKESE